ncbi:MAG: hypothetical protein Q4E13_04760 [Clostridia bacterium]|nr:hypothetical protein [Clostridia bacterium]
MERQIPIGRDSFTAVHTAVDEAVWDGRTVLRVVKDEKIDAFDENTYAKVNGVDFHDGAIEVRMLSRLLPDAPDFARGFVGIVFRAGGADEEFEAFYVRPTNGRACADPVRRAHGCQYFAYPGYTFSYFREFGIAKYEARADIDLDEWITLKAVVEGDRAAFYLNGADQPALTVDGMKHGADGRGSVGIYVDTGTEAFVSDFRVTCAD